ncbi:MAG: hypothetical protein ABJA71_03575 [Ginsengibacter sp.]
MATGKDSMMMKDMVINMDTGHNNMEMGMDMPMSHSFSLNLPMNRNSSGTGWLPNASPMYGYMTHSKNWMYMVHGNIFFRYNNQDIGNKGSRGSENGMPQIGLC